MKDHCSVGILGLEEPGGVDEISSVSKGCSAAETGLGVPRTTATSGHGAADDASLDTGAELGVRVDDAGTGGGFSRHEGLRIGPLSVQTGGVRRGRDVLRVFVLFSGGNRMG